MGFAQSLYTTVQEPPIIPHMDRAKRDLRLVTKR